MFYIIILCVVHAINNVVPALATSRARLGLKYNVYLPIPHVKSHVSHAN